MEEKKKKSGLNHSDSANLSQNSKRENRFPEGSMQHPAPQVK